MQFARGSPYLEAAHCSSSPWSPCEPTRRVACLHGLWLLIRRDPYSWLAAYRGTLHREPPLERFDLDAYEERSPILFAVQRLCPPRLEDGTRAEPRGLASFATRLSPR